MDASSPDAPDPDAPGPPAWVEPADGQSVTAQVIGRLDRRSAGGGWWYEGRLPVWAEVELPNRITVEPDSIVMSVPARLINAIEGTDYSTVPTRRNLGQPDRPTPPPPPRQAGGACSTCPHPPAAPGAGSSTTSHAGHRPATRTSRSTRRCASSPGRAANRAPPAMPAISRRPEADGGGIARRSPQRNPAGPGSSTCIRQISGLSWALCRWRVYACRISRLMA
ncbi:hypothetical protein GCM10009577_47010 [Streptomyces javensis]